MKKLALSLFAAALGACGFTASAQLPGPAVAVSANVAQLPAPAQQFLDRYFNGVVARSVDFEAGRGGGYEVELVNGVDVDFDHDGRLAEISSHRNAALPAELVKAIVPPDLYAFLVKNGVAGQVEDIEFKADGRIEVDTLITDPDTFVFDAKGNFTGLKR